MDIEEKEMNVYELAFNFSPALGEEALATEFGNLKDALTKGAAVFIEEEYPKLIDLAYEMNKIIDHKRNRFNSAYFGWIKFEILATELLKFENEFKLNNNVIRYMILRTVKESTLAPKKTFSRDGYNKRKGVEGEEPEGEMDKEEVDQKIEELVS